MCRPSAFMPEKAANHTVSSYTRYDAEPGASVPVIGSFDRYLPMTLAYEWMVSGNYYDKTRYAMVQTYLWGCLAGYEEAWDVQEEMMHKLESVIRDGKVLPFSMRCGNMWKMVWRNTKIREIRTFRSGTDASRELELKDGRYELTLDIGSCPSLRMQCGSFRTGTGSMK